MTQIPRIRLGTLARIRIESIEACRTILTHMTGTIVDVNLAILSAITGRTLAFISQLVEPIASTTVETGRRFTRNIFRVAIPPRIPRFTYARIRTVGVKTTPMVTRPFARTTGTFDHVLSASGTSESRRTRAGVTGSSAIVRYASTTVSAWLRGAVVFVGALSTSIARRTIAFVGLQGSQPARSSIETGSGIADGWYAYFTQRRAVT